MPDLSTHRPWCGPACDADRVGGHHRGASIPVGDRPGRPLATVSLMEVDGKVRVTLLVGHTIPTWTPEQALRVAAAIQEVAGPLVADVVPRREQRVLRPRMA